MSHETFPVRLGNASRQLVDFVRDVRGSTATEYALIAGFLSIVIVFAVTNVGESLLAVFSSTATALE